MKAKEICSVCDQKLATWIYCPGFDDERSNYFCDDCVPRGCQCNHEYVDVDAFIPPLEEENFPTEFDIPFKWIEQDKIWTHIDKKGREFPCCEYDYDENGFEIE